MDKFLKGAEDMANALGTSGKGEVRNLSNNLWKPWDVTYY